MQEVYSGMTAEQAETLIFRVEELLEVLGTIQTYILFFVAVALFYFSYKFLRMFF